MPDVKSLRLLLLPIVMLPAACAEMSQVGPVSEAPGNKQYRVTYNAGMQAATWVEIKNAARDRARAYCTEQGLRMIKPEVTSNHATGLMPKEATVTFTCEKPPAPKDADGEKS
jgi:hypothetical protein